MAAGIDLKPRLDELYDSYNAPDSATDPIQIVRRYSRAEDLEIVAFCAAALAFGRVASVLQSVERLVGVMGARPAEYLRAFDPARHASRLEAVGHRWVRPRDAVALLWVLKQMVERSGSIEAFFAEGLDKDDEDVGSALDSFAERALALDLCRAYGRVPARPGVAFFFPRPSAGSACKRLNLFLRWMVRRDAQDLGVWSSIAPAKLVIPLDTHVMRVARCLRLTRYTSPGWRMAQDITRSLRKLDPRDPVRYDFAICHMGMKNACGFSRPQGDAHCPLRGLCRPRARTRPRFPAASGRR